MMRFRPALLTSPGAVGTTKVVSNQRSMVRSLEGRFGLRTQFPRTAPPRFWLLTLIVWLTGSPVNNETSPPTCQPPSTQFPGPEVSHDFPRPNGSSYTALTT